MGCNRGILKRCHGSGARRTTQDIVHLVGTLSHEVGTRRQTAQQDEVEGVRIRSRRLPCGGAPVNSHADTHITQVTIAHVGPSAYEAIIDMTRGVGDDVDKERFHRHAGFLLLAVDMSLFSRYRRKHTGIVVDADNGIARYFPERCLRVEVPVYFSHIDVEAVGLVLHEDGIAEQV